MKTDILIVGGGTGGVAAALAAAGMGRRVVLTEETDWLGGQLTSQAVPPDENTWIESFGCTRRYRAFRDGVRRYYRDHYPLTQAARANPRLNPGGGFVSHLCHEPRVALAVIEAMLAPYVSAGAVRVLLRHVPVAADAEGDAVRSVTLRSLETGREVVVEAPYVLDATELGDVLPLAGVEYVTGAESRAETGEPSAVDGPAQPGNVQAITWCFPMAWDPAPGADHTIDEPAGWSRWRAYVPRVSPAWPGKLLSWTDVHPITLAERHNFLRSDTWGGGRRGSPFFTYRQIVSADRFEPSLGVHDVTLVNWPMNDYIEANLIDTALEERERALRESKELSLCLFYWLQTEAENHKTGEQGFRNLYLRPDLVGTADGLAKYPYIRESRRIRAAFTVTENHVGVLARYGVKTDHAEAKRLSVERGMTAERFADSVGIGHYRIDLHISTGGDNYIDVSSLPFQIPLGALIPVRVRNVLPACKNLGVTHITNGCYRLHPIEWNIGEAAGALAAFCLDRGSTPRAVWEGEGLRAEFQKALVAQGVELDWPVLHAV